ncbi:hypothetical protein Tco_0345520 [Tanacetum coccineum]
MTRILVVSHIFAIDLWSNDAPVMSSASSAVTYTSVYTNSKLGRVFWGADKEISEGGTEPVIPPPSTDITTTGARITVRLQASISLPPEAEVERLLAMLLHHHHHLPHYHHPLIRSAFQGARSICTFNTTTHVPSLLLPLSGCPTQIQTLRITSTQALIDTIIVALPSPPLPPLPSSHTYTTC